jgi:uncharacterized protein
MQQLFVDTSAWVAMSDRKDAYHQKAITLTQQIAEKYHLVITNYILDETYTLLLMNAGYPFTLKLKQKIDFIAQQRILEIVWVTQDIADQAWRVFEQFNTDKQWSFTDCVSFVVMQQKGITEAFTFDHHFSQMGLIRLPTEVNI